MSTAEHLDQIATEHGGVICLAMAHKAGVSRSSYNRWVHAREAVRLAPGVHLVQPARGGRRRVQLLRGALLANGGLDGNAALAGRSALWAHGLVKKPDPPRIAIGSDACKTPVKGVDVIRVNRKLPFRVITTGGWPSLSVEHSLLDLAREVDDLAHLALCCDALREGKLDPRQVLRLLADHPGMHGSARLGRSLERLVSIRPDAVSEVLLREGLERVGVRTEPRPRWVPTAFGTFQVDVPFLDVPGGAECDSVEHHTGEDDLARDHDKTNALATVGFRLLRFTYKRIVHDLDSCVAQVQALVAELLAGPQSA